MNEFKIAWINIKKLFKNNTGIFLTIISSIIISVFGILFYSGYFLFDYYSANYSKETVVSIEMEDSSNESDVKKVLENIRSLDTTKIMSIGLYPETYTNSNGYISSEPKIIGKYDKNFETALLCGENFTIDSNQNEVLVDSFSISNNKYNQAPLNEEILLFGNTYKIKGVFSPGYEIDYVVPIHYYAENYITKSIIINLVNFSNTDCDIINNYFNNIDKIESVSIQTNTNPLKSMDFISEFLQVLMIFCVSFLCIFLMINFWVKKLKQTFSVYVICGCAPKKKMLIIVLQLFIVFFLGTMLGFAIFMCFFKKFGELNLIYTQKVVDYLIIILIVLITLCIYSIFYAVKKGKEKDMYIIEV